MGQLHHFLLPVPCPENQDLLTEKHIEWNVLHHIKVLRIKKTELIRLMDGNGGIIEAQCVQSKPYEFRVLQRLRQKELNPKIELCLAPPRGDLNETLHQATEIGVSSIRFLKTDFSQYASHLEAPVLKSQRVADASCEQSTRAWKCAIQPGWFQVSQCLEEPGIHIFADESLAAIEPECIGLAGALPNFNANVPMIRIYIGSEGGWSERERRLFDGKGTALSLGSLILRVPTAVVAAVHFVRTVYSHSVTR